MTFIKIRISCFLILLTSLLSISSCQKRLGGFQASSRETFNYENSKKMSQMKADPVPFIEPIPETPAEENNPTMTELPVIQISETLKNLTVKKAENLRPGKLKAEAKKEIKKEKPKKKKDKKRRPKFNDALKTGTVFLLIAVVMGIFSLTQLTLLFGLVSVLFLYFGLKKYYRQQRRKNIFK